MKPSHASLISALGFTPDHAFGTAWRGNPTFVMQCLASYCREEGHTGAIGRSVESLAREFVTYPNDGTGEQLAALACLLAMGRGQDVIPQSLCHPLDVPLAHRASCTIAPVLTASH